MKKIAGMLSGFCGLLLLCASCQTMATNPYPGLETERVGGGQLYTSRKGNQTLLVFISGSGMHSVLGIKDGPVWTSIGFSYFIAHSFESQFDLALPEKIGYKRGKDYAQRPDLYSAYTVEALIDSYVDTIDGYLERHPYESVILFGLSEGGLLAPRIYNEMKHRSRVSKLVVWGAGGFSQAESFRVLSRSPIPMPDAYRRECARIDEVVEAVEQDPQSTRAWYLGWPFVRWNSFFAYTPADEYHSITIPVLFVQGRNDFSSPVESVYHIRDTVGSNTYTYWFREMGHIPEDDKEIEQLLNDIAVWIAE
ncbi:MAG: alpha/beta hydrolase [Spirochaeta sp.]